MSNFVHKSSSPDTSQSSNLSSLFNKKNKISDDLGKAEGSSIKLENKVANKKFIKIPFLKLRLPIQAVLGFVVLLLLVVGGASAMFLTQMNQDVRQQASGAYCGDGICQNKGNPCQCLQDCSGEPGADQCGQSGTSSSNTSGSTSQSSSSVASTGGSSSACKSGEIFCGGCINGCRPANVKCNTQIDNECKQTGCGGNGVFPAAGEQCCSGLQQCANGRCAPSCSLDSNPICGGIREGSNCNNGGSWTCNSAGDKGTCVGGVWNQPVAPVGGTKTIEEVKEPVVQDTNFSTSSTAVYNIRCGLGGEILYVSNEKTCTDYKGVLVTPTLSVSPISYNECKEAHLSALNNKLGICKFVSATVGFEYQVNEVAPVSYRECIDAHASGVRNLLGTCEWVSAAVGYEYQANEIAPVSYGECVDAHASGVRN
ncbi:MAG: hypothetical protein OEX81_05410, partial [Candidatus Pacebacteria bacterium]|nr:hypothetical protein [Candidatus Paceibacterota bacterium]